VACSEIQLSLRCPSKTLKIPHGGVNFQLFTIRVILKGLNQQERELRAQLEYLCTATGTTWENFLSKIRQGWTEDEDPSPNDDIDLAEVKRISKDLREVREEIPTIQEIENELAEIQKNLNKARESRKRVAEARKGVSDELERFEDLTNELKGFDAKIGALEKQRRLLHKLLTSFGKLDDRRGVEDMRTLRSFLAGKRMKQAKLDAMRKFFTDRLKAQNRNGWLLEYINDFFSSAEMRGQKTL
jgi:DNA repair exonuclease SbcCD ATPase subunit